MVKRQLKALSRQKFKPEEGADIDVMYLNFQKLHFQIPYPISV